MYFGEIGGVFFASVFQGHFDPVGDPIFMAHLSGFPAREARFGDVGGSGGGKGYIPYLKAKSYKKVSLVPFSLSLCYANNVSLSCCICFTKYLCYGLWGPLHLFTTFIVLVRANA